MPDSKGYAGCNSHLTGTKNMDQDGNGPNKQDGQAPKTLSVPEAGWLYFRLGRNASYEAAHRGQIPVIPLGRKLRVPVAALERMCRGEGLPGPGVVDLRQRLAGPNLAAERTGARHEAKGARPRLRRSAQPEKKENDR